MLVSICRSRGEQTNLYASAAHVVDGLLFQHGYYDASLHQVFFCICICFSLVFVVSEFVFVFESGAGWKNPGREILANFVRPTLGWLPPHHNASVQ